MFKTKAKRIHLLWSYTLFALPGPAYEKKYNNGKNWNDIKKNRDAKVRNNVVGMRKTTCYNGE